MLAKCGLMLMVMMFFVTASPCLAQQDDTEITTQVKALLDQHNKAFNEQDLKGVMEVYASDPDIVLMGSGPGEAYVGKEGIEGAYNGFFTRFKARDLKFRNDWITINSRGDVAWFAVTTHMEFKASKKSAEKIFNFTGTLEKEAGKWRIVAMHFSRLGVSDKGSRSRPK